MAVAVSSFSWQSVLSCLLVCEFELCCDGNGGFRGAVYIGGEGKVREGARCPRKVLERRIALGTGWGRGVRERSGRRVGIGEGDKGQRWMTRGPRCGLVVTPDAVVGSAMTWILKQGVQERS